MGIISTLLENAKKGYIISEIEDKMLRGEELTQKEKQFLSGKDMIIKQDNALAAENNDGSESGSRSGTSLSERYCVSCYVEITANARFCNECGRQQ